MAWKRDYERIGEFRKGSTFSLQFRAEGHWPLSCGSAPVGNGNSYSVGDKGILRVEVTIQDEFRPAWRKRFRWRSGLRCSQPPALAQDAAPQANSAGDAQPAGESAAVRHALPSVVKATAIVNGEVITQTDIDQRLALLAIANNSPIPANEIERLRQQVLQQPDRRDAADPGRQGRRNRDHRRRHRQDRRARRRQCEADARADGRISQDARLLDPLDPPPDPGRNRLAPAASRKKIESTRQRRRRRGEGGHRQARSLEGRRGISGRRDLPLGQQQPTTTKSRPTRSQGIQRAAAGRVVRRLCPPILAKPRLRRSAAILAGCGRSNCRISSPTPFGRCARAWFRSRSRCPAAIRSSRSRTCARS